MLIKQMQISFVAVECLADPLRAQLAPKIPFSFLLSGPLFRGKFSDTKSAGAPCCSPWANSYARYFWDYYIRKSGPSTQELWRAMVPLEYSLTLTPEPTWEGQCLVKALLYPWGIGVLVDASILRAMNLDDAVNAALNLRWAALLKVSLGGKSIEIPLAGFIGMVFDAVRVAAYGSTPKGSRGELFTVVTAVDGEGGDLT